MNIDDFIEEIKNMNEKWMKLPFGSVRTMDGPLLCPIHALHRHRGQAPTFSVEHAGRDLGLSTKDVHVIIATIDNTKLGTIGVNVDPALRIRLLEALNLPEDDAL